MTAIELDDLTLRYGEVTGIEDLTLDLAPGEITAFLGPSGCGKTTVLKLIAGLLSPTSGRVRFDGRDVTDVVAEKRGAVMVFQDHRLFPHLSVGDNVAFGLRMRGVARAERRAAADRMLARVGLPDVADRRPSALSGGQRQRVALARALVLDPAVLLLDEPLANLDAHLRDGMRALIADLQRERELTTVVVTHDQEEAVVLADHLALVFDGRLHQHGAPRTFFERPATARTARFFGSPNLIPGRRDGREVATALGRLSVPDGAPSGDEVLVVVRPERLRVVDVDVAEVTGTVRGVRFLGTRTRAEVDVADQRLVLDTTGGELADLGPGRTVGLALPPDALWTVPAEWHAPDEVAVLGRSGRPGGIDEDPGTVARSDPGGQS